MPDWNRIIVGDAFKVSSHDINYYRDLFLLWPFLSCSIASVSALYSQASPADRLYGFKMATCAVLLVLLAKEKRILILGSSGYVALRVGIGLVLKLLFFRHDLGPYLLGFLVSGSVAFIAIRSLKGWHPSYRLRPAGQIRMLDLLVGVTSLGCAIALHRWIKP
jgi:hypothetical protein